VQFASEALAAYSARLARAGLDAPWSRPGPLIPSKATRVEPYHWRWAEIEPLVRESAAFVTPGRGAERRILRIANPGVPERTATHTISVAVQYLLPGETAPRHRHTPNAVRFMVRGRGAYTVVEGERFAMAPGDLVVTPSLSWHEHGNDGDEPVLWIDGLDSPVVRYLELLKMESPAERDERSQPGGTGRHLHFTWEATSQALLARAAHPPDPYDDVLLEYRDPRTGGPVLPTLGCYVQLIRPGVATRGHRQASSAVYYVFCGRGVTMVDERRFVWHEGDFFAVPPWASHRHLNDGDTPAVLFSLQDVPLVRALGLYAEEPDAP
jgi:gentisate 1,2-dioxygenase